MFRQPRHDFESDRGIFDAARDRPDVIERPGQREHPFARHGVVSRLEADDAATCGRLTNGTPGAGTDGHGSQLCGNGGGRQIVGQVDLQRSLYVEDITVDPLLLLQRLILQRQRLLAPETDDFQSTTQLAITVTGADALVRRQASLQKRDHRRLILDDEGRLLAHFSWRGST